MLTRWARKAFVLTLLLFACVAMAAEEGGGDTGEGGDDEDGGSAFACPDASVISGKMLTDICWSCLFPIKVAGVALGGGSSRIPDDAADQIFCACEDDADGTFQPGLTMSMWEPARIVELVKTPGCSPTLGGARLPTGTGRAKGKAADGEYDNSDVSFYHYHYYAFPILLMLDLFVETRCNAGD